MTAVLYYFVPGLWIINSRCDHIFCINKTHPSASLVQVSSQLGVRRWKHGCNTHSHTLFSTRHSTDTVNWMHLKNVSTDRERCGARSDCLASDPSQLMRFRPFPSVRPPVPGVRPPWLSPASGADDCCSSSMLLLLLVARVLPKHNIATPSVAPVPASAQADPLPPLFPLCASAPSTGKVDVWAYRCALCVTLGKSRTMRMIERYVRAERLVDEDAMLSASDLWFLQIVGDVARFHIPLARTKFFCSRVHFLFARIARLRWW